MLKPMCEISNPFLILQYILTLFIIFLKKLHDFFFHFQFRILYFHSNEIKHVSNESWDLEVSYAYQKLFVYYTKNAKILLRMKEKITILYRGFLSPLFWHFDRIQSHLFEASSLKNLSVLIREDKLNYFKFPS